MGGMGGGGNNMGFEDILNSMFGGEGQSKRGSSQRAN